MRGAEHNTGDGAGILIRFPTSSTAGHRLRALPAEGAYATGIAMLPRDAGRAAAAVAAIDSLAAEENLTVLGWRGAHRPDAAELGPTALAAMPAFRQLFVGGIELAGDAPESADRHRAGAAHVLPAQSGSKRARHVLRLAVAAHHRLQGHARRAAGRRVLPDLTDERVTSALAIVHSRFSTNTFPAWPLAHRSYVAHNGEINTLRGNRNWMAARGPASPQTCPGDLSPADPDRHPDASDASGRHLQAGSSSCCTAGGRSLPHAVLMMIQAWEHNTEMDPARRAVLQYHSTLMEPWDGPALVAFTDGTRIGAVLDRGNLPPARYWVTEDGLVVLASEVGVLDVEPGGSS
ncbi:hypothetical protein HBB16_05975 [Pseudonocardia sp. MCCB 268]|nr:hypothetical protein [Pseudonocardia cytotoxica]